MEAENILIFQSLYGNYFFFDKMETLYKITRSSSLCDKNKDVKIYEGFIYQFKKDTKKIIALSSPQALVLLQQVNSLRSKDVIGEIIKYRLLNGVEKY